MSDEIKEAFCVLLRSVSLVSLSDFSFVYWMDSGELSLATLSLLIQVKGDESDGKRTLDRVIEFQKVTITASKGALRKAE